jgi:hypothetical protein
MPRTNQAWGIQRRRQARALPPHGIRGSLPNGALALSARGDGHPAPTPSSEGMTKPPTASASPARLNVRPPSISFAPAGPACPFRPWGRHWSADRALALPCQYSSMIFDARVSWIACEDESSMPGKGSRIACLPTISRGGNLAPPHAEEHTPTSPSAWALGPSIHEEERVTQ